MLTLIEIRSGGMCLKFVADFRRHLHIQTFGSGLIATIFGATGPILIIISGALEQGLTYAETISWIFAVYFIGGLFGIFISLKYRQPISGAFTIAGAVLVVNSLSQYTIHEAVGAYLFANMIVFVLGITGLVEWVMRWIPVPIVMGMIVGLLIHFVVSMINVFSLSLLAVGVAIVPHVEGNVIYAKEII